MSSHFAFSQHSTHCLKGKGGGGGLAHSGLNTCPDIQDSLYKICVKQYIHGAHPHSSCAKAVFLCRFILDDDGLKGPLFILHMGYCEMIKSLNISLF